MASSSWSLDDARMVLPVDSDATAAPPIWVRHRRLATVWCAIKIVGDASYQAFDGGCFNVADLDQFEVDVSPAPAKRCAACIRAIEHARVGRGLAELVTNAPEPLIDFEMVDLGGEG